jgi:hypothetical protein
MLRIYNEGVFFVKFRSSIYGRSLLKTEYNFPAGKILIESENI